MTSFGEPTKPDPSQISLSPQVTTPNGSNYNASVRGASANMSYMDSAQAGKPALPATPSKSPSISQPSAPSYNMFSRPGDGNGDAQGRASQYDNLISSAASQTGFGSKKRSAAMLYAAQGMIAPGLAQIQQQGQDYGQQMGLYGKQMENGMLGGIGSSLLNGINDQNKSISGLMQTFQNAGKNGVPGATPEPGAAPISAVSPISPQAPGTTSTSSITEGPFATNQKPDDHWNKASIGR